GTGTLNAGQATFATSTLTAGRHSITAVYSGDTQFASSTSPVLTQAVDQPVDSVRLRGLQILITKMEAQSSGQCFSGSVDRAISEGFSERAELVTPGSDGVRLNFSDEQPNTRVADAFGTIKDGGGTVAYRAPREWFLWADVRGTGWNTNPGK